MQHALCVEHTILRFDFQFVYVRETVTGTGRETEQKKNDMNI